MVSQHTPSSRSRLLARSRLYLAAVVTGGVAAGAGFTVAAAHADPAATSAKHTVTRQNGQQSQPPTTSTTSTPSAPSVRSAPGRSAEQAPSTRPQRAGSSHAS